MAIRLTVNEGQIARRVRQAAERGCLKAAHVLLNEYLRLILRTPKSGRRYGRHTASAPGEPPASDTGLLVRSARVVPINLGSRVGARVVIGAEYARKLEYGGGRIKPRPALRPALKNKKAEMVATIKREMAKGS